MADVEIDVDDNQEGEASKKHYSVYIMLALAFFLLLYLYSDALLLMAGWWERDEYSHGYMIPVIAILLTFQLLPKLSASMSHGSWWGAVVVGIGMVFLAAGELSSLYTVTQYSFLLALYGLALAVFGWRGVWVLLVPLAYLIFMIPLPNFLYNNLSQTLQLLSSELGVMVIRLFDISVYLEGNVIDLGVYKLQVVEACSGLRYLFPLMSFGFLIAVIYKGPLWHKVVIFLSTIPITLLMNSFRIGVIGVTVEYWGIAMAEGFLHDFEGWVIFMACLLILFFEILLLGKISGMKGSVIDRFDLDLPDIGQVNIPSTFHSISNQKPLVVSLLVVIISLLLSGQITERDDDQPLRDNFTSVPLNKGSWTGRTMTLSEEVLSELKLTDYINANYINKTNGKLVNLYSAYYASQRKGASIHSPKSCLPGGGWVLKEFDQHVIKNVPTMSGVEVNRSVIVKDDSKQLVYYWFEQRGRKLTNEYMLKWYLMHDAITLNRTDGALVRLVAPVGNDETVEDVDKRFEEFLVEFYPDLMKVIPGY